MTRRSLAGLFVRFAAGSAVATACSLVTFVLLYGPVGAAPVVASVAAWFAGAVPNFWLSRSWTWQRRGRLSLVRELFPYAGIVLGLLALATAATTAADRALDGTQVGPRLRVALVAAAFVGVYGLAFVLRFALLHRLFRGPGAWSGVRRRAAAQPPHQPQPGDREGSGRGEQGQGRQLVAPDELADSRRDEQQHRGGGDEQQAQRG